MHNIYFKLLILLGVFSFAQYDITIHANNRVASLKMPAAEYDAWVANDYFSHGPNGNPPPNPVTDNSVVENLSKAIYQKFNDDFDFIYFVLNEDSKPSTINYFGKNKPIRSTTQGIGIDNNTIDRGNLYGSPSKLKMILHLPALKYLEDGPSLHELYHIWGNFGLLAGNAGLDSSGNLIEFNSLGHWGFTGHHNDGEGGMLGGFDQNTLTVNSDGSFTVNKFGMNGNGGNKVKYSEFELYLMGMISIDDVKTFDSFKDITSLTEGTATLTFNATRKTYNKQAILQLYGGPRVPSHTTAQKDFKGLVIVLTKTDLTQAQWSQIDAQAERFERNGDDGRADRNNFWEATRQNGTLELGNLDQSFFNNSTFETDDNQIHVFPNPSNGTVNLVTNNTIGDDLTINLVNTLGQQIGSNIAYNKENQMITLNLSKYPTGVYYLSLEEPSKDRVLVKKIVLE